MTYESFLRTSVQLGNAWPTQRFPAPVPATTSSPTGAENEDLREIGVSPLSGVASNARHLPSAVIARPSLLKMYSTNLRRYTLWPGQALYDRADDCLVVSLSDEWGVAVIDAITGRLLSLKRLRAAQGSAGNQLRMSEGWIMDASGDREICVSQTFSAYRAMTHSRYFRPTSDLALRASSSRGISTAARNPAQI
ncbi:hypothetical protein BCV69DRAFT_280022 [Microstroma glucosiphilum]|uniref:Uncharacterized protein n=1 Tax=Pseudomicrostroma glucosiphilum TaxID=1684307 RepID=A0A316UFU4_9BASI|nr:hypothetical protein BCV69DRAFT_280022 [Pseudomicrostroma glucosiphilum]PWN24119.1 hypothetical protein BCV69DRAFT_280022 [Pseudomicrostroma glucosiphilum]